MTLHARQPRHTAPPEDEADQSDAYFRFLQMLERLHRLMLDLIKDEFERIGRADLTPVQAMLIYHLGQQEVSAGELRSRGMYQGSNVSYNLKKLVSGGYVTQMRSDQDRRALRVSLSEEGRAVRDDIGRLFARHADDLVASGVLDDPPLDRVNRQAQRIERYWAEQIRYIY
ncbi:MAG: MarR family transcriptional regulator [Paracoccus sp. (in: a-proteobacteria)]|nr:MarR family transcriptional regulator [Paracoccus sp. (in: a-proteobacteria)]